MHDAHARAKYGVGRGGLYYDEAGRLLQIRRPHREPGPNKQGLFQDGAGRDREPPALGLVGEAGPEAIIPLSREGGGFGNVIVNIGEISSSGSGYPAREFREFAELIAREV